MIDPNMTHPRILRGPYEADCEEEESDDDKLAVDEHIDEMREDERTGR